MKKRAITCDAVLKRLRANKAVLDRYGVTSIAVFGSTARNEARPKSDVDILVDFSEEKMPGIFDFLRLKQELESILGHPVDLATPDALHRRLRDRILSEAVYA